MGRWRRGPPPGADLFRLTALRQGRWVRDSKDRGLAEKGDIGHLSPMKAPVASKSLARRFSVAPMMEWTDRHCRFFHRLMTRRALIYTEMVTTGAVLHGDRAELIGFDPFEHPVALQLGGCDPRALE